MAQKKKEKDVLVVRDEKTGEIGVVSGLNGDGTPKTTPATGANQQKFLSFDKNSNVLESFFENFYRQCKEPKRFGFYRVAADNIGEVIDVFKDMLKDPVANRDLLEPHRIDTSKYEQQPEKQEQVQPENSPKPEDGRQPQTVSEEVKPTPNGPDDLNPFWQAVEDHWSSDGKETEKQGQTQEQEQTNGRADERKNEPLQEAERSSVQNHANTETEQTQKKPDGKTYLIDESRINWSEFKVLYGISRQELEASGNLEKMLNGGKSSLMTVSPIIAGERFEIEARLSFKEMSDGTMGLVPHTIRKEPKLDEEFMGVIFTPEDKENLKNSGNLGRVAEVVDKETGEIIPSYISIDRLTNEIEAIPVKDVPIIPRIGRTEFSEHEMSELRAGRAIPNKEIVLSDTRKFKATLQVNVERGGVEFVPRQAKPNQSQNRKQRASGQNTRQNAQPQQQQQNTPPPATQNAQQNTQTASQADGEQKPKVYNYKWVDENGNIRAPKTMGGVPLTAEQQKTFSEGKAILVKDMKRDGKGEPYTAYVKYNFEAGKPKYFRNNPDVSQAKEVAPASESRTQVAVNTDGKTNEATKHLQKPLQQGQAAPANAVQQEQQQKKTLIKPKGVKM